MLPTAVAEQQAQLGVSAEDSKAQRLKRQQARFRDRGGAFVPSTSNPLVDILLARTVSGESPSKPKPAASRKCAPKPVEPEADGANKPAARRRGRPPKAKKETTDSTADTEKPSLANPKPTSKAKGRQRNTTAPSTTKSNRKSKSKQETKRNPVEVIELFSDDDQTLVEVPRKANPKRVTRYEDDSDTGEDAPLVRPQVVPAMGNSKASSLKTVARVKKERARDTANSGRMALDNEVEKTPDKRASKANVKKRQTSYAGNDDEDVAPPPVKKGKAAKSKRVVESESESEPAPRTTKDIKTGKNRKAKGQKDITHPDQGVVVAEEVLEHRPSKSKKRKKEEDNFDDQPRKAVKFAEATPPHASSRRLKENLSEPKRRTTTKAAVKDEPDAAPRSKQPSLATKTTLKGPPREVLERIKASAARHLRCADSEPDELDCLS